MRLTKVERMKIKRQRKGISLTKLAEGVNTDRSNLSKYEKEQLDFPYYLWEKYCTYIENYKPKSKY